jgi:hypothetical protein
VQNCAGSNRCQNQQELRHEHDCLFADHQLYDSGTCSLKAATGMLRS